MKSYVVRQIRNKIAEIKSEDVKRISQGQLDLLLKTNASKEALEDFLGDVKRISQGQLDLLLKTNASKEALEDFLGDVTFVVMFQ